MQDAYSQVGVDLGSARGAQGGWRERGKKEGGFHQGSKEEREKPERRSRSRSPTGRHSRSGSSREHKVPDPGDKFQDHF